MITNARSLGMKVMVGSMNESTVGSAAIAHLNPLLDYVDMDGPYYWPKTLLPVCISTMVKLPAVMRRGWGVNKRHYRYFNKKSYAEGSVLLKGRPSIF